MSERGIARWVVLGIALASVGAECANNAKMGQNANQLFGQYCTNWARCQVDRFRSSYASESECTERHTDLFALGKEDPESKGGSVPVCLHLMKGDECASEAYLQYYPPGLVGLTGSKLPEVPACRDLFERE